MIKQTLKIISIKTQLEAWLERCCPLSASVHCIRARRPILPRTRIRRSAGSLRCPARRSQPAQSSFRLSESCPSCSCCNCNPLPPREGLRPNLKAAVQTAPPFAQCCEDGGAFAHCPAPGKCFAPGFPSRSQQYPMMRSRVEPVAIVHTKRRGSDASVTDSTDRGLLHRLFCAGVLRRHRPALGMEAHS